MRVGIPASLLYYQYYPLWVTFFQTLGAEVVVSSPTDRTMLSSGSSRVVDETCLPVKVFIGHVISLVDKCDCVFIPAVRSVERQVYNCSKFLGLPDMTRAVVPGCPPVLEVDIDADKGRRGLYWNIYKLGSHFTRNPVKVKKAAEAALEVHRAYTAQMCHRRQTPGEVMEEMFAGSGKPENNCDDSSYSTTIGLVGHPYLLYDDYVSHRLISRLWGMGARVLTPEMVGEKDMDAGIIAIDGGAYWTYGRDVVGAGGHYLQSEADGVIGIMAFGCGPDSLMMDAVRRYARQVKKPFMCLNVDEHTADAGMITRLEAFMDMIRRNREKGNKCG